MSVWGSSTICAQAERDWQRRSERLEREHRRERLENIERWERNGVSVPEEVRGEPVSISCFLDNPQKSGPRRPRKERKPLLERVLAAVRAHGPLTQQAMMPHLPGHAKGAVGNACRNLLSQGLIAVRRETHSYSRRHGRAIIHYTRTVPVFTAA